MVSCICSPDLLTEKLTAIKTTDHIALMLKAQYVAIVQVIHVVFLSYRDMPSLGLSLILQGRFDCV